MGLMLFTLVEKNLVLRAYGGNFTQEEMLEGIKFAHERGKKVYVTVNIFPHNSDINSALPYLKELKEMNVDAVLVSDIDAALDCKMKYQA